MKRILSIFLCVLTLAVAAYCQPGTLNFPTSLDTLDSLFRTNDRAASVLSSLISNSATTIPVVSAAGFPSSGAVVIDNEIIYYTGKTTNTLTGALRGQAGSTAALHLNMAAVRGAILAVHHNTQSQALINLQSKLGFGSSTPVSGYFLRGSGTGSSAWAALVAGDIPDLAASKITSGVFGTARLGTGTADGTVFLRGDGTWAAAGGGGEWGSITGTLADQTDLQSALDAKLSSLVMGTTATNGTAGSVFFAGTAGVFQEDNANFFYDSSAKTFRAGGVTLSDGSGVGRQTISSNNPTLRISPYGVLAADFSYTGTTFYPYTAAYTPLAIRLAAAQTADAFQVKNSADETTFAVAPGGYVYLGQNAARTGYFRTFYAGSTVAVLETAGGVAMRFHATAFLFGTTAGASYIGSLSTSGFNVGSAGQIGFSSGDASLAKDSAFSRFSAGVITVTDGSTGMRGLLGGGAAVASATALPLPTGNVFHVTGTTNITSFTMTNFQSGVCFTMIFDDVLTVTDGNNAKLAGDFVTTTDDTLTGCYDGTNFYETSRAVN